MASRSRGRASRTIDAALAPVVHAENDQLPSLLPRAGGGGADSPGNGGPPRNMRAPRPPDPRVLVDRLDPELLRLGELGAGAGPGDDEVGLGRDRARDLGAQPLGQRLGFVAGHLFERAREHDGLAGERVAGRDRLHRLDPDFPDEGVERRLVARLGEEIGDRLGDHWAYSADRRKSPRRRSRPARRRARIPSRRNGARGAWRWSRRHGGFRARRGSG